MTNTERPYAYDHFRLSSSYALSGPPKWAEEFGLYTFEFAFQRGIARVTKRGQAPYMLDTMGNCNCMRGATLRRGQSCRHQEMIRFIHCYFRCPNCDIQLKPHRAFTLVEAFVKGRQNHVLLCLTCRLGSDDVRWLGSPLYPYEVDALRVVLTAASEMDAQTAAEGSL